VPALSWHQIALRGERRTLSIRPHVDTGAEPEWREEVGRKSLAPQVKQGVFDWRGDTGKVIDSK